MTSSSLARRPAPLLAVVGGPTGAGKSTLVNSLVRAPVSRVGVLRPTTRQPVLICHPSDSAAAYRHGLRPIAAPMLPAGIALIDAPDIESIEEANRSRADELFYAADLWLFVVTATRYADAAAWKHLRAARERGVALAVVLDRVPGTSAQQIIDHLRDLLGPPEPPLFVVPESTLDRQGMLPDALVSPLRGWLAAVVAGPPADRRPAGGAGRVIATARVPQPLAPATAEHPLVPATEPPVAPVASPIPTAAPEPVDAASETLDQVATLGPAEDEDGQVTDYPAVVDGEVAAPVDDETASPHDETAPGDGTEPGGVLTPLDGGSTVGETVQSTSRPTPAPVGVGPPSDGPLTDPGDQP